MAPGIDDIKLTAYALGELEGAERAEVAAYLAGNEPARRYVAEVRATASLLSDELARESFGGLTDLQHASIEQKLDDAYRIGPARPRAGVRRERLIWAMSMAAAVLIVFGVISILVPFVYHRIDKLAGHAPNEDTGQMPFKIVRGTHDGKQPDVAPPPADHVAVNDGSSADDGADEFIPAPDNRLAMEGAQPQETPLVGAHTDITKPAPQAQATNDPAVRPGTPSPPRIEPGTAITLIPVGPPRLRPEAFMSLSPKRVPGKNPAYVAANPGGSDTRPSGIDSSVRWRENPFIDAAVESVSGFSGGVDTASYSNIRRFLGHNHLPPTGAVRVEEMLNYFPVRPITSSGEGPLATAVEIGPCPWDVSRRLARVCLQGRELSAEQRPPVNLVLVVDVSVSMRVENKLPLVKKAMKQLAGRMGPRDHIALIAYSQDARIVLPSTVVTDKPAIFSAIDRLETGGRTEDGRGIEIAYAAASSNFIEGGMNRVILATDGNWSVGASDSARLSAIAAQRAREGVSLTVVGVGMENLNDATMRQLALAGGGSYAYVDTLAEARKVLVDQLNGTLVPVAKDVKVKVRFNPAAVAAYRLVGYERRALSADDIDSDSQIGGELGAGQSLTALYEIIPAGKTPASRRSDLLTVAVHYRDPASDAVQNLESPGEDRGLTLPHTSADFRFAAAVAEFGLLLRESNYKGNASYASALERAQGSAGPDETGYRQELVGLVRKAKLLASK
jgi:Ca-activated chloride channel family protein